MSPIIYLQISVLNIIEYDSSIDRTKFESKVAARMGVGLYVGESRTAEYTISGKHALGTV